MRQQFAVKGGIGDFLQYLPFMLENPEHSYLVASHYDKVLEFFGAFGLKVEELSLGRLGGVKLCPRGLFFNQVPFKHRSLSFDDNRPVLGVHLGGSDYSVSVEKRFGFPSKVLPLTVLTALRALDKYNIVLFGSPSELNALIPQFSDKHLRIIADDDVTVSLSYVPCCTALVGSDSAFKTMSAMLQIPTVVWLGDYTDNFRDDTFINPYVKVGIMSVFRYRNLASGSEVAAGVEFSIKEIAGR